MLPTVLMPRRLRLLMYLAMLAWLAACAMRPPVATPASSIGPYPAFSGRLIVIEPTRRWQVAVDWKAATPSDGWLRLTHAASGRVLVLTWHGPDLRLSDNQDPAHPDRPISEAELAAHGIVIPPSQLAAILLGHMPPQFSPAGPNRWQTHSHGHLVRIDWYAGARRLTLTDMKSGSRVMLLIDGR
jgi:outer membrane biogenesis lipoprotein LolB